MSGSEFCPSLLHVKYVTIFILWHVKLVVPKSYSGLKEVWSIRKKLSQYKCWSLSICSCLHITCVVKHDDFVCWSFGFRKIDSSKTFATGMSASHFCPTTKFDLTLSKYFATWIYMHFLWLDGKNFVILF